MLAHVEQTRRTVSKLADPQRKSLFGQFFTPASIADFMAGLFSPDGRKRGVLLDAGAGVGSLCAAFLDRWSRGGFDFGHVEIHAFEIDKTLHPYLEQTLAVYGEGLNVVSTIRPDDFVIAATDWLENNFFAKPFPKFTHAILNPPYKKIRSNSEHRLALRRVGIETVNLYSAFVALSLALLDNQGQLVAIVPRSFCNGLYYRPFRNFILNRAAIRRLHLFESRSRAFKDDDVLQENIIIYLERGGKQGGVKVSTSTDERFNDLTVQEYPFEQLVSQIVTNRQPGRNPLFDVMFNFRGIDTIDETPEAIIPGLKLSLLDYEANQSKFDITLYARDNGDVIDFTFACAAQLFRKETVEMFSEYFRTVSTAVLENAGQLIANIEVLSREKIDSMSTEFSENLEEE